MSALTHTRLVSILCSDSTALPFRDLDLSLEEMTVLAEKAAPKLDAFGILRLVTCDSTLHTTTLLTKALTALTGKKLMQFEAGCLALERERWDGLGYDPSLVFNALMVVRQPDLPKLVVWQKLIKRPLDLVEYWSNAIQKHLLAKEWYAAWNALRVAVLGHPKEDGVHEQQLEGWNSFTTPARLQEGRMLFIPFDRTRRLVMETFTAMQAAGIVTLGPAQFKSDDDAWIVVEDGRIRRPGLLEASGWQRRLAHGKDWPLGYEDAGQMMLGIAKWIAENQPKSVEKAVRKQRQASPSVATARKKSTPKPRATKKKPVAVDAPLSLVGGS